MRKITQALCLKAKILYSSYLFMSLFISSCHRRNSKKDILYNHQQINFAKLKHDSFSKFTSTLAPI
jgi:hypothetical protein